MPKHFAPIAMVSLALGIIADWFFFDKAVGISWPLYIALIVGAAAYIAHNNRHTIDAAKDDSYWLNDIIYD